jgi:hypothetical protein
MQGRASRAARTAGINPRLQQANGDFELIFGILSSRGRECLEARFGPERFEDGSDEARPYVCAPVFQPGIAVALAFVFVAEFRR